MSTVTNMSFAARVIVRQIRIARILAKSDMPVHAKVYMDAANASAMALGGRCLKVSL